VNPFFSAFEVSEMPRLVIDAVYEDGVLKPDSPLPIREHQRVRVSLNSETSWAERTAGLLGWDGSAELADCFAMDPELDPNES
jgi:predicted DNA-binding antitoxin AbrB/MazE fold protein